MKDIQDMGIQIMVTRTPLNLGTERAMCIQIEANATESAVRHHHQACPIKLAGMVGYVRILINWRGVYKRQLCHCGREYVSSNADSSTVMYMSIY
jgi:hypothetical protein